MLLQSTALTRTSALQPLARPGAAPPCRRAAGGTEADVPRRHAGQQHRCAARTRRSCALGVAAAAVAAPAAAMLHCGTPQWLCRTTCTARCSSCLTSPGVAHWLTCASPVAAVVSKRMAWENIYMAEVVRSCPEMCRSVGAATLPTTTNGCRVGVPPAGDAAFFLLGMLRSSCWGCWG